MLGTIDKAIKRWRFKRSMGRLRDRGFCIVANNCLGSRFYKILDRPYNTPFVGLFLLPDCISKLVADFDGYMAKELRFVGRFDFADWMLGADTENSQDI